MTRGRLYCPRASLAWCLHCRVPSVYLLDIRLVFHSQLFRYSSDMSSFLTSRPMCQWPRHGLLGLQRVWEGWACERTRHKRLETDDSWLCAGANLLLPFHLQLDWHINDILQCKSWIASHQCDEQAPKFSMSPTVILPHELKQGIDMISKDTGTVPPNKASQGPYMPDQERLEGWSLSACLPKAPEHRALLGSTWARNLHGKRGAQHAWQADTPGWLVKNDRLATIRYTRIVSCQQAACTTREASAIWALARSALQGKEENPIQET